MVLDNAPSWQQQLSTEFEMPYMKSLKQFLRAEKDLQKVIYPHSSNWFHALD
ncbi:MAG TPA: uracil-DNA glycosylase, partial [Methylophaga sp.]|nr:uracil-DNA glycosylase [Methylophaga sp.]